MKIDETRTTVIFNRQDKRKLDQIMEHLGDTSYTQTLRRCIRCVWQLVEHQRQGGKIVLVKGEEMEQVHFL